MVWDYTVNYNKDETVIFEHFINYDLSLSPCINRYILDFQNLLFFLLILLSFVYIILTRSKNQKIINANFFKPFNFIDINENKFIYFIFCYHFFFTIIRIFGADCKEILDDPFQISPDDTVSIFLDAGVQFKNIENLWTKDKEFIFGSNALSYIISPLVTILRISYFNINLLFSMIGFYGIYKFYLVTKEHVHKNELSIFLLLVIIALPNFHYWTSILSKDVLIFFFLSMFLFYSFSKKNNDSLFWFVLLTFIVATLIRPYFGIIFTLSYIISFIITKNNFKIDIKLLSIAVLLLFLFFKLSIFYYPIFDRVDKLGDHNGNILILIDNFFNYRLELTSLGYFFDYEDSNYFTRFISYLFVPLHLNNFDPKNIFTFLNNFVQLCVMIFLIINITLNYKFIKKASLSIFVNTKNQTKKLCLLVFIFIFLFLYSNTTSNYGIIMRQKETIMFIFYFYLIIFYSKILHLKKNT